MSALDKILVLFFPTFGDGPTNLCVHFFVKVVMIVHPCVHSSEIYGSKIVTIYYVFLL
jgi:hypothetical protein